MNVKISLPYNHRIHHVSPNENFTKSNMRSNTNSLGYNLNFFDRTKAKMFFNRNPSFSKEKITKPSSQTPKRNLVKNKQKHYAKTNILTVRENALTPVNNKISHINKRNNININTDSPTFKKFSLYKKNNASTYNTNNNSKTKNVPTFTNRIHKINVIKTSNNTHNNTSVKSREKINKRNNHRKITPSKTFQPSLSQQNNLLMHKHKKRVNDDIITADLISEQERKKVILHTVGSSKNPPPGKITKIQTQRYNNNGKQLSIDTNQNNLINKEKKCCSYKIHKVAHSNNNKNIRTNRINHIQIEDNAIHRLDQHNSNSITSPNNFNSTGMRTCSQFKNRYKNLIESYLLSTSEIEPAL